MTKSIAFLSLICFSVAFAEPQPKQLWTPSPLDAAQIEGISKGIQAKIEKGFKETGKAVRDAHAKHHGCVKADFTVVSGLDKKGLGEGVFSNAGKTYKVWIRFSNGSGDPKQDDRVAGGRGMAIKLFGVEGPKFLDDEKLTQDFQMINFPVFFVKNVADYVQFSTDPGKFFSSHPEEAKVVGTMGSPKLNPPINPLESTYYSMTARQHGPVTRLQPIKFAATPVPCTDGKTLPAARPLKDSTDALRLAMRETLQERDACFDFQIQLQTNDTDMPVENPVKLWDEKLSPFQTVAKIVIEKQAFEGAEQETFCEDISITPWHSIAEHQPLGTIELTRKAVYQATSELRHKLNGRAKAEPNGDETFNH